MDLNDFGTLQLRVLELLWEHGPATAGMVCKQWPFPKRPAYTTILSALQKLYRRRVVRRRKEGRAHVYTPCLDRATFQRRYLRDVRDRAFGGSAAGIVAALFDGEAISADEFQKIKSLIAQRERDHD